MSAPNAGIVKRYSTRLPQTFASSVMTAKFNYNANPKSEASPSKARGSTQQEDSVTITVKTESGSVYEFDMDNLQMRRVPASKKEKLRQDNKWVQMLLWPDIDEGYPIHIALAPLAKGYDVTMRHTTPVVEIVGQD